MSQHKTTPHLSSFLNYNKEKERQKTFSRIFKYDNLEQYIVKLQNLKLSENETPYIMANSYLLKYIENEKSPPHITNYICKRIRESIQEKGKINISEANNVLLNIDFYIANGALEAHSVNFNQKELFLKTTQALKVPLKNKKTSHYYLNEKFIQNIANDFIKKNKKDKWEMLYSWLEEGEIKLHKPLLFNTLEKLKIPQEHKLLLDLLQDPKYLKEVQSYHKKEKHIKTSLNIDKINLIKSFGLIVDNGKIENKIKSEISYLKKSKNTNMREKKRENNFIVLIKYIYENDNNFYQKLNNKLNLSYEIKTNKFQHSNNQKIQKEFIILMEKDELYNNLEINKKPNKKSKIL